MLGRIGSGSTVAALPLATALTAAAQGWRWLTILASLVLAAVLLVTFAPWIPHLRGLLPSTRRVEELDLFWAEGYELLDEEVKTDDALADWLQRREEWHVRVAMWITQHFSASEAMRFAQPSVTAADVAGSYNHAHSDARNHIEHQLPQLIRLRDDQKVKP